MLSILTLLVTCVAVDGLCFPTHCRRVSWVECKLEHTRPSQHTSTVPGQTCILCNNPDYITPSQIPTPVCLREETARSILGIRGYPLGVFSASKLPIPRPSTLDSLALVEDGITDVEKDSLRGFTGLLRLNLARNELTHVKQGWFAGLGRLQHLILSHNKIVQIDPGSFDNLTLSRLELQHNLLQVVNPDWFYGLYRYMSRHTLHTLSLGSNPVTYLPPRAFRNVPGVQSLGLGATALSCLDKEAFWGLRRLKSLNVSGTVLQTTHDQPPSEMPWSFFTRVSIFGNQDIHVSLERLGFSSCFEYDPESEEMKLLSLFGPRTIAWEKVAASHFGYCPELGDSQNTVNSTMTQPPFVVIVGNGSSHEPQLCGQAWGHSGGLTMALGSSERLSLQLIPMDTYRDKSFTTVAMVFDHPQNNSINYSNSSHGNTRNISCFLITKNSTSRQLVQVPQHRRQNNQTCFLAQKADNSVVTTEANQMMTTTTSSPVQVPTDRDDRGTSFPDHVPISIVVSVVGTFLLFLIVGCLIKRYTRRHRSHNQEPQQIRAATEPATSTHNHEDIVEESAHSANAHTHQEDDHTSNAQNQQEIPEENNHATNEHNQKKIHATTTHNQETQEDGGHTTVTYTMEDIPEESDPAVATHKHQEISTGNDAHNRVEVPKEEPDMFKTRPLPPIGYQATGDAAMTVRQTSTQIPLRPLLLPGVRPYTYDAVFKHNARGLPECEI